MHCLAELSVDDVEKITWDPSTFDSLTIPNETKEVLMAVAENRLRQPTTEKRSQPATVPFDDFVAGKGRGLNVLLQYAAEVLFHLHILTRNSGPPGVGKTLTAEALSEHFKRPLYSVRGLS